MALGQYTALPLLLQRNHEVVSMHGNVLLVVRIKELGDKRIIAIGQNTSPRKVRMLSKQVVRPVYRRLLRLGLPFFIFPE